MYVQIFYAKKKKKIFVLLYNMYFLVKLSHFKMKIISFE